VGPRITAVAIAAILLLTACSLGGTAQRPKTSSSPV